MRPIDSTKLFNHNATNIMKLRLSSLGLAIACTVGLTACVTPGGLVSTGSSPTEAKGAAAGGTSVGANPNLQRCDAPLGTLAVDDGRGKEWYGSFGRATQVTSIEPLIRLAVQQSNCFVITSVGNARTESKISAITDKQRNSGEFRTGSNQQAGQRVAADYFLDPAIVINNSPTGRLGAALGGLLPGAIGGVAGSLETKSSVVTLTLTDIRSGVQIGIAEGNATSTNFGAALGAFGGGAAGGLSGFSKTPEGKASVAAFVDAYNGMVVSLRNYRAQTVKGGLGRGGTLKVGD
jgi:hypothetical protein